MLTNSAIFYKTYPSIIKRWNETNTTQSELRVLWNWSPATITDDWLHETSSSRQTVFTRAAPLTYTDLWTIVSILTFNYAVSFRVYSQIFPQCLSFSGFLGFLSSAAKNDWRMSSFTFLLSWNLIFKFLFASAKQNFTWPSSVFSFTYRLASCNKSEQYFVRLTWAFLLQLVYCKFPSF